MENGGIVNELPQVMEKLLDRHMKMAKEWFPHEMVDWSQGDKYDPDYQWSTNDYPDAAKAVRSAIFVNLLTEDNLPYYVLALNDGFGVKDGVWGEWGRRWAAEEGRHSIAIRDWISLTRIIDPVKLERARMTQVTNGWFPAFAGSAGDGMCFVTIQELATRIAHRNTGQAIDDPMGRALMTQIAMDENLHYLFYRDLSSAAFEMLPDEMMQALSRTVRNFAMPGVGIPGFQQHSYNIALARILDLTIFYDHVLEPLAFRHWKVDQLQGLSAAGEIARDELFAHMEAVRASGERFGELRDALGPKFVLASA
jgi:acyl-[acyl-carrier-protein] desaturase